jgi:hypothetical protein
MPIIIAVWKAKIGRIKVFGQHRQKKVFKTLPPISTEKAGVVTHVCHSSHCGKHKIR